MWVNLQMSGNWVSGVSTARSREEFGVKVIVEEPRCVAAGQCVLIAPDVFDQRDDDGIVVLLEPSPGSALHAAVRESAIACPASAIHTVES